MTRYRYEAYDAGGAMTSGHLDGVSREAALSLLARRGEHAIALEEAGEERAEVWWQRQVFAPRGLNDGERLAFTRELAALLKADLPVDEALDVVLLQPGLSQRLKRAVTDVRDRVRQGQSLSRALASGPVPFPDFYWRLVAAGETGGALAEALEDLAHYLERAAEVRARIASALAYPLLLLAAAFGAVLVITLVLVPAVMPLFEDAGSAPPLVLSGLATISDFLRQNGFAVVAAILALALASFAALRDSRGRHMRDRALLALPLIGPTIATRETARLARILSAQIKNGVPLLDGLAASAPALGNGIYRDALRDIAARVAEGAAFSKELAAAGLFSDLAVRLAGVGERTGGLDTLLARAADIHEQALQRRIDRMTRLIGPLLTLATGLVAGGLILSVMQAILSINDLALR